MAARASLPDVGVSDRGGDEAAVVGGRRSERRRACDGSSQILSDEARQSIRFVCSDMWQPYLNVIAEQLQQAVHVLDRFHIMKKMNEAIDEVRREEARRLEEDGYEPVLKHSRWCLLKRRENRTDKQTVKLSELLAIQPAERSQPSVAGGLPAVLGVPQSGLGGEVPGPMVYPHHAEQDRTDEEDRSELCVNIGT